jgi:hypothetical protein
MNTRASLEDGKHVRCVREVVGVCEVWQCSVVCSVVCRAECSAECSAGCAVESVPHVQCRVCSAVCGVVCSAECSAECSVECMEGVQCTMCWMCTAQSSVV